MNQQSPSFFSQRDVPNDPNTSEARQGKLRHIIERITSRPFLIAYGVIAFVLLFLAAGALWYGRGSFRKDDIALTLSAPEAALTGKRTVWRVTYRNGSRKTLRDVEVIFTYPPEVVPVDSPANSQGKEGVGGALNAGRVTRKKAAIPPGGEETLEFGGIPFASQGTTIHTGAQLRYHPEGITSLFEHTVAQETIIQNYSLNLRIDIPNRIVSGQEIDVEVRYASLVNASFPELEVRLDYPTEFRFSGATPPPVEGTNIWRVTPLAPHANGMIHIRGTVDAPQGSFPTLHASLTIRHPVSRQPIVLNEAQRGFVIKEPPLTIAQEVNNSLSPIADFGQTLQFVVKYANTTDLVIPEVRIKATLEGKLFELRTIKVRRGSVGAAGNEVIWNASVVPELAVLEPGETGSVGFSVALRRTPDIRTPSDKNFTVKSIARIESLKIPLGLEKLPLATESTLVIPLNSPISFDAQAFYRNSDIANSGPIPPQVGKTTTYTIVWQMTNASNDLENVRVRAAVPPHIKWQDVMVPDFAPITYNPLTGEVVWDIGEVPAHTGFLRPAEKVSFQVALTPAPAHIGGMPELISASSLETRDTFTNTERILEDKNITTRLPDDPTVVGRDSIVIP